MDLQAGLAGLRDCVTPGYSSAIGCPSNFPPRGIGRNSDLPDAKRGLELPTLQYLGFFEPEGRGFVPLTCLH